MQSVFRYEIKVRDEIETLFPQGMRILKFGARQQHPDVIEFWALVDVDAPLEMRKFRFVGTGHEFPDANLCTYLDTVITAGGALVWHVFQAKVDEP